jgi:thiol:disulfide interchange protein
MKKLSILVVMVIATAVAFSQDMTKFNIYSPAANAKDEIENAVKQAKKEGKNVLIQIGGNWCIWCARFNEFTHADKQLDSAINAAYVVYHLNYSKENYNPKLMAEYHYPQRFGFPVFLILNDKGDLIHTQNSWYLEDGKKSYDKDKTLAFLNDWAPRAFDPKQYKEQ